MDKIIPLRNFSYTRAQSDEDCQRKNYLSREWGGTGLIPVQAGWNLVFGNIIHKALEDFAKSGHMPDLAVVQAHALEEAGKAGFDIMASRDWATLTAGLLLGFEHSMWPGLMAEYEVVETEKWIEYEPKPGFKFRARQDLLLRNRFDGHFAYVDYKTTSSTTPQWIASWNKSIQLHSSMLAMRKTTSYPVERAIVIGFSKGYKDKRNNIPCKSPLNYGYANREFGMTPQYSYDYQRSRGWELMRVGEEFEDLTPWIAGMPESTLSEQYPRTGPIFAREDIAETWFRQQLIREAEIVDAIQELHTLQTYDEIMLVLDTHFKQNFSKCDPAFGYKCDYEPYCWIPHISENPLEYGFQRYQSELDVE